MRRKMTERNKSLGGVKKAKKKMKEIVEILWETLTNLLKQKTKQKLPYYRVLLINPGEISFALVVADDNG